MDRHEQASPADRGNAPHVNQETGANWSRVETLLASALELTVAARASFLDTACRSEPGLRAELDALLAASTANGPVDLPLARFSELLETPDTAAQPRLNPGDTLGPYVIVAPLGFGGMGQVYRARDARLDREVAVKIVSPQRQQDPISQQRLEREARMAASLSHPNVLAVYDIGEHDGTLYLVTELLTGRTVRDILRAGPLPESGIIDLARQVARGLTAAHARHIVHRDLKPENLFVTETGLVKILDFGLARPHDESGRTQALTAVHALVGTIAYMAPEQITGDPVDARTDLFALGAVLYEAASGHAAFTGATRSELVTAILSSPEPAPDLPGVSPALARMIVRCLARSPDHRYQSAADLEFTIELLASDHTRRRLERTAMPHRASRARWITPAPWIAAAIAALAVTATFFWGARQISEAPPVTFVVHAPKGATFSRATMGPRPSLSPDGRLLAFVASMGSRPFIWVQTLGQLEARPVVPAAGFPFWSPDGKAIGFGSSARLQRVAVSGNGAAQDICICDAAWGGSWSRDGTVLFAGEGGLHRVSSEGGEPVEVTRLDPSRDEFGHWFPVFLRDGKHFLYLVRSERIESRGIYLGSLDDPGLKIRITGDDSQPAPAIGADGQDYVFFVRDRVLLAQQFDLARRALVANPVVIAQPVVPGEGGRFAPFAVGGRSIVYRSRTLSQTPLAWIGRQGHREGYTGAPDGNYDSPAFSPDGTRIAVIRKDAQTDKPDIWVIDVARRVTERLTNDPVGAFFPVWTPDGSRVVFGSARSGRWKIYSQAIAGGAPTLLFGSAFSEPYPTSISPDGRYLVAEQAPGTLWLLPLSGRDGRKPLIDGGLGRISPDGRWLAYVGGDTGRPEVYVTSFPSPGERQRISMNGGYDPQWRPDGRELYFVATDRTLMSVTVPAARTFRAVTARPLFRLSPPPEYAGFTPLYAAAPDGQGFLVVDSNGNSESPVGTAEMLLTVTLNWTAGQR